MHLDSRFHSHVLPTLAQLRFTWLAVGGSRKDFHLQDRAHAGRIKKARTRRAAKLGVEPGDQGTLADLSMKGRPSIVKLPPNSMFMVPVGCTGQPPDEAGQAPPPAKITEP